MRDTAGSVVDRYSNPLQYISSSSVEYGLTGLDVIHHRADLLPMQDAIDSAFDPYIVVRSAWLQRREHQVKDGELPDEQIEIFENKPDGGAF